MTPYFTVITATRGMCDSLMERCIPSVKAQAVRPLEHVIVSEWDPELRERLRDVVVDGPYTGTPGGADRSGYWLRHIEVGQWNRDPTLPFSPGAMAYYVGTHVAMGRYVGFCGDDDELLPHHLQLLVRRLEASGADFAVGKVDFRVNGKHRQFVGDRSLELNKLDTIGIVCSGHCFHSGRWRQSGDCSDHDLVQQWLDSGLQGAFLDEVTAIHHDGWLKTALEARGVEL